MNMALQDFQIVVLYGGDTLSSSSEIFNTALRHNLITWLML